MSSDSTSLALRAPVSLVRESPFRLMVIQAIGGGPRPPQDIPQSVFDAVDLSVECSPVLPPNCLHPKAAVKQVDGRYTVDDFPAWFCNSWLPDTFHVEASELRLWRARYLIMRDLLFHALVFDDFRYVAPYIADIYSYSVRQRVLAAYFPKGVFVPGKDNPIRASMDAERPPYEPYIFGDGSIAVESHPSAAGFGSPEERPAGGD